MIYKVNQTNMIGISLIWQEIWIDKSPSMYLYQGSLLAFSIYYGNLRQL